MAAADGEPIGPTSAIVRINREVGGHCTGFAVDRDTVMTAAHCLWLSRPRSWVRPKSLHVLVGYDRGSFRQHIRVAGYRIGAGFAPQGRPDPKARHADWAVLELESPFEGAPIPLAETSPTVGAVLSLAGFAGSRAHRLTRYGVCRVLKRGGAMFLHDCPAGVGQSGSPLFGVSGGQRLVFGVHTAIGEGKGLAIDAAAIRRSFAVTPY